MAIVKMSKVVNVAEKGLKESLLSTLQSSQSFQIDDLKKEAVNHDDYNLSEVEANESLKQRLVDWNQRIEGILQYLDPFIKKETGLKAYRQEIPKISIETLNKTVSDDQTNEVIGRIQSIKTERKVLSEALESKKAEVESLNPWVTLSDQSESLKDNLAIVNWLGTIPQTGDNHFLEALKKATVANVIEIFQNEDDIGLMVSFERADEKEVQQLLRLNRFSRFDYNHDHAPHERLEMLNEQIKEDTAKRAELRKVLSESVDDYHYLQLAEDYYSNRLNLLEQTNYLFNSKHLIALSGWTPTAYVPILKQTLAQRFDESDIAVVEEVADPDEQVPIKFQNSKMIAPFEVFTEMYALPKYSELDPTPLLMPFYFVLFGMMGGDLGYGILLFLVTLFAQKKLHFKAGMRRNIKLFHILSYAVMMWGILFGTFFGFELPFAVISPMTDVNEILILSVMLGFVQIISGLLINAYIHFKHKEGYKAFTDGIGWVGIFSGLAILIAGKFVVNDPLISSIGQWTAIGSAIAIVIFAVMGSKNKFAGFGSGLYNLYGVTSYVGDLVSYTRLMALAVSSASIAFAFNAIIEIIPVAGRFTVGIILFLLLHALNIFLSFLSAYVHGIRLQFVEFFGKFYTGGGTAFKPLKVESKHYEIVED